MQHQIIVCYPLLLRFLNTFQITKLIDLFVTRDSNANHMGLCNQQKRLCAKSSGLTKKILSLAFNGRLKGLQREHAICTSDYVVRYIGTGAFHHEIHVKKENRWSCADATRAESETETTGWGYNTMVYGARVNGGGNEKQRFYFLFVLWFRSAGLVIHSACFPVNLQQKNLSLFLLMVRENKALLL